jgi:hypothetical protein
MIQQAQVRFAGQDCLRLENDCLALWLTTAVGPRILGLAHQGGRNLFAELPDFTTPCPGAGLYHFYGGHRLWHAPEDPRRTYLPDDSPPTITASEGGLRLTQAVEARSGIQKELLVRLAGSGARVEIEHRLTNCGAWEVTLAPWAITQLRPGGEAFLPLAAPKADPGGFLPNRSLAFWPYSDLTNPLLKIGRSLLRFRAEMRAGAFKVGVAGHQGWLAYLLEQTLFIKRAAYQPGAAYFDLGSASELYCNDRFLELETLGPQARLEPGATAVHLESWQVLPGVQSADDEDEMAQILAGLGAGLINEL